MHGRNLKPNLFSDITMLGKMFETQILAPIKRPLSRKNTSPSQKKDLFFAGTSSSTRSVPCRCLHPGFQNLLVRILIRSATRHPSGSRPMKEKVKIDGCEAERSSLSRSEATILFLCGPWSVKRTPEKHRYLVMSNGLWQNKGLQEGQPLRAHDKGRSQKRPSAWILFKGVQRRANQEKGFWTTIIKGSPLQSPVYWQNRSSWKGIWSLMM